jgi:hypothetical protein
MPNIGADAAVDEAARALALLPDGQDLRLAAAYLPGVVIALNAISGPG